MVAVIVFLFSALAYLARCCLCIAGPPLIAFGLHAAAVTVLISTILDRFLFRRRPPERAVRHIRRALVVARRRISSRRLFFATTVSAPSIVYLSQAAATANMNVFQGAIIDSGATRSCIGIRQARNYCRMRGIHFEQALEEPQALWY